MKIRLIMFSKNLNMGSLPSWKHKRFFEKNWTWDQYLYKVVKWNSGNTGAIFLPKHEMLCEFLHLRDFGTFELRNFGTNEPRTKKPRIQQTNKLVYFHLREPPNPSTYRRPPLHQPPSNRKLEHPPAPQKEATRLRSKRSDLPKCCLPFPNVMTVSICPFQGLGVLSCQSGLG